MPDLARSFIKEFILKLKVFLVLLSAPRQSHRCSGGLLLDKRSTGPTSFAMGMKNWQKSGRKRNVTS